MNNELNEEFYMEKLNVDSLQIGDWILDGTQIAQITGITCDGIVETTANKTSNIELIEPIPITSEILEKNGFGYIKDDEYSTDHITHFYLGEPQFCKNMNLHIGTDNKGNFWINTRINTIYGIKYVHEFQNALRICKIEENIKL